MICNNGTIERDPNSSGDMIYENITPSYMQSMIMSQAPYFQAKVFRNTAGTNFVMVTKYFANGGKLDGKAMSGYPVAPAISTDVFDKILFIPTYAKPPCCLKIDTPSAIPNPFKPSMDQKTTIAAGITANYPINWTLNIYNKGTSGSGGSATFVWDGKNGNDPLPPGVYQGLITAMADTCNAQAFVNATIIEPPNQCKASVNFGSTANVTTGNLSFSQELFSTRGGTFPVSFTLNYNSLDTTTGPISPGWRHNFDITLLSSDNNGKVLFEGGKRHVYSFSNGAYAAEAGDTSLLNSSATEITFIDGRKYAFNANGTINSITDKNQNVLTFGYTGGDLTSISDGWRTIALGYDTGITPHRLTTITDPNQDVFTLAYQNSRLWKVINPVTDTGVPAGYWEYTYNTGNLLQTKKDPGGNTIQYGYSGSKVNSSTDPNNKTRGIVYPTTTGDVRTTTFTEKDGGQWQYTYDIQSGFLKEKTLIGGKKTSYYYNSDTTLRAKTEPFDNNFLTTFYTYDQYGNQLTQTDPVNISTYVPAIDPQTVDIASLGSRNPPIKTALRYTYDPVYLDQIASVTDERFTPFRTTTYQYTSVNGLKVTTVTDPEGKQTITRENANGTIAEVEDGNGKKTTYTYYPDTPENRAAGLAGQLESITAPDNVVTRYTFYDHNGNPQEVIVRDTAGRETTTVQEYDALNRLRKVTRYAVGLPDNITRYSYDNNGNRNSIIDPENHETRYEYNFQGQVTKVTDARLKDTTYEYGATGCPSCSGVDKLTAVVDARQKRTSYQYNTLGQLERETDPLNKVIRYTYYDNGLLKEKIDTTTPTAEVVLITHYYDTQGRLTKKHYADGTEATFTYYPDGALWTATNQNISYTYTYYKNGWLKSVTDSNGRVINYDEYDNIGQKKTVNYFPVTADAKTVTYGYDGANRLETITGSAGIFTIGYDNSSRRHTLSYPNQITATYDYDDLNRLTSVSHAALGGGVITDSGYTHYDAGNRKTKTGTVNESYNYDETYRLTDTVTSKGIEHYTYDDVGNRKSGPGTRDIEGTYQYNDGNQLITGRTLSFIYDNRGNQTNRVINNALDKEWTLSWDYENRLTKVEKKKGTSEDKTTTFKYDPMGRRIEKKHVTTKDGISTTITTTYVYDGDNIALEITTDGTTTSKTFYTHGLGPDEPLAMERDGSVYYYHADGLGSITAITDESRTVVQRYTYDSFGMPKATTTFKNSYMYTGREWDKETGLYYYRARYYEPLEGRFVSKDPAGFKGGINLYSYVQNQPVSRRDPSGLVGEGMTMGAQGMALVGGGRFTSWCCDGCNLWMIRGTKFLGGLGFGFVGGVSMEHGDKKNCPGGYSGASIECVIGPLSGSSSLGSDWTSTGVGPGWGMELFVISIAKMDPGYPRVVGKCSSK
ncbi:RHS repeat-associated core domain-containing protein [Geotalea sp. SG265]|uniref:RHS repeat domain-containing protein n=1 Tax=Geotalea sp. SG265 TaxID=2922867 RepID=UPI001FAED809|nr:RHS repeat-associated core domain-containing protein [Geotalea sp. SG265]